MLLTFRSVPGTEPSSYFRATILRAYLILPKHLRSATYVSTRMCPHTPHFFQDGSRPQPRSPWPLTVACSRVRGRQRGKRHRPKKRLLSANRHACFDDDVDAFCRPALRKGDVAEGSRFPARRESQHYRRAVDAPRRHRPHLSDQYIRAESAQRPACFLQGKVGSRDEPRRTCEKSNQ